MPDDPPMAGLALAAVLLASPAAAQLPSPRRASPQPLFVPATPAPNPAEAAANLPPGFLDETVGDDWGQVVGLACAPDGRLFVWEKLGLVFTVQDDVKQATPVLDLREEVASWGDHGLMGLALDPEFEGNGLIYVLYAVDHHHLAHFGTPQYDPAASEEYTDTIGRITRYKLDLPQSPLVALPESRRVLLGADASDGFPICMYSHGVGSLVFGSDGSLLASCGTPEGPGTTGTCFSEGILQPKEDVDTFRAQLVDSLCGKIVRISSKNGAGLASNPWFDPQEPRAPRSRVWALGLRNPYRFARLPGTGSADPSAGDPGTLLVNDVGEAAWEDLHLGIGAALNYGWPLFEGQHERPAGWAAPVYNLDAPNPLFGGAGCDEEFFAFQDLIQQDSLVLPPADNPCAPGVPLPPGVPSFVHARPALAWSHDGHAVVPVWGAAGEAASAEVGADGSPATGQGFGGVCGVGGAWVSGAGFPAEWQERFFFADYGLSWLRALRFAADGSVAEVQLFAEAVGGVVSVATDGQGSVLWYANLAEAGGTAVHRIRYVPGNLPPVASVASGALFGPTPLAVQFDAAASSDPEGGALGFAWDFGDGTFTSQRADPLHVFPSQDVTALGSIVSRLDELSPSWSMGVGNADPEVIRDGVIPPEGTLDAQLHFDTFHFSPQTLLPDKQGEDWIGYVYSQPFAFSGVLFVEGVQWPPEGGWFDDFTLQVRQGGTWNDVPDLLVVPAYAGDAPPTFEAFELVFEPVEGDGIRLHGVPGGIWEFFSVGELRVSALAPLPPAPVNVPVTLTVTDDLAATDVAELVVSLDNTPPQVQVLEPQNGDTYHGDTTVPLEAAATDAEQGGALACTWEVILHHDEHEHPEPPIHACAGQAMLEPHAQVGEVQYYEVRFTATDPLGLATSQSVWLLHEGDQNLNGQIDSSEVAAGAPDLNGNGVPDDIEQDCDGSGLPDVVDIKLGLLTDGDGDGVPDRCDPLFQQASKSPPVAGPQ